MLIKCGRKPSLTSHQPQQNQSDSTLVLLNVVLCTPTLLAQESTCDLTTLCNARNGSMGYACSRSYAIKKGLLHALSIGVRSSSVEKSSK